MTRMHEAANLIGADEATRILGIARSTLTRRIADGRITPAMQMPGDTGAFLFDRAYIEQLAAEKAIAAP